MSYPLEILPYHERASKIDRWYAQDLGRNIATKDRKYLGDRRRKYPDLSRRDLKKMLLEDDYKEYKRMQVIRDEADNEYKAVLATQKERCPDGLDSLANLRLAWRSDRVYSADKP